MKKKDYYLIYILLFVFCTFSKAQILPLKVYYTEDGLASSQVWSITQDRHGYIWMGCSSGISKFNGFKFVNFRLREGLPSESINKIVSSKSGIVVALTVKGLAYIRDWGERFEDIPNVGEYSDIAIFDSIKGKNSIKTTPVLFAAIVNKGLFYYDFNSKKWSYFGFKEYRPTSLQFLGNKIIFSSLNGNIYTMNLNKKSLQFVGKTKKITGIRRLRNNKAILISEKAIYLFDKNKINEVLTTESEEEIFFDAIIDIRGNLWVASNFGVRKTNKKCNFLYTSKNGIPGIRVLSLYESKEGILWLGTNHGVCKLMSEDILVFKNPEKTSAPSYISFYYDREKKTMMIGNTTGVILIKDNKVNILNSAYLSKFPVWAILKHNKNYYFTTEGGGVVVRTKDGREKHFRAENRCLPGNNATDLLLEGDKLFVSCKEGFAIYEKKRWKIYDISNKLPVSYVRCLEHYKNGKILLGTLGKGVLIYHNGKFSPLLKDEKKEFKAIYDIYYDKENDTIWAATNYGLAKIKNGKFKLYDTRNGFLSYGLSVVYPVKGYLWVGSDGGALLFDKKKERVVKILTKDDGLPGNEFTTHNAIAKDEGNNIWFGFFGGAAKLKNLGLTETEVKNFNPRIFLKNIQYFYKGKMYSIKIPEKDKITIPYNAKEIFINFDVIWFRNEYSLNIYYKLEGINTEWNRIKDFKDMKIYFTSITPGTHNLFIKVFSILTNRKINKKILEITVPTPWWQEAFYQALITFASIFLIIMIVFIFSTYKNRKLIREKQKLNKLVEERTVQLELLNKELEQKNEALKELANHDYLTGLFNRRYFMNQLDTLKVIMSREERFKLCLIIFDIDNFKSVNDTYGHAVGDEVLKAVANIILKNLRRKSDMAARYGGEEFIVALFKSDPEAARIIAENIRKEIENTTINIDTIQISVTISGGIQCADISGGKIKNLNEIIEKADKKLYLAKRMGKNRIEG